MIQFEETIRFKKPTYIAKEKELNLAHAESQDMFRRLVERGHASIFLADIEGYLFYVNHAFVRMMGYEKKDDLLGTNLADTLFKDPEVRADFLKKMNTTGSVREYEVEIARRDQEQLILSVTSNLVESSTGAVIGIEGMIHDVTQKTRLEEELMIEKKKLEEILAFDESLGAIKDFGELVRCVVDRTAKILEVVKCSLMIVDEETGVLSIAGAQGLSDEIIRGVRIKTGDMIAGTVVQNGQPLLVRNIEYDRKFQRANRPAYIGRSFMVVPVCLGERVVGVINVADRVTAKSLKEDVKMQYEEAFTELDLRILSAIAREVSVAFENIKLYNELNSLAVTDPLTHIFNYRQFSKSLDYEIKRCRRNNTPLCMIMIDIDNFKTYNDAFGHLEGDALLKNLSQIFRGQLREVDIICRYAGDEFAIILPDTNIDGAIRAARKIKDAVAQFTFRTGVTLSFGIANYFEGVTQYKLIQNADGALYKAKQEGKDNIFVFK